MWQNRELQIMRKLDHQNIVKLRFFFYSSGDKVFITIVWLFELHELISVVYSLVLHTVYSVYSQSNAFQSVVFKIHKRTLQLICTYFLWRNY